MSSNHTLAAIITLFGCHPSPTQPDLPLLLPSWTHTCTSRRLHAKVQWYNSAEYCSVNAISLKHRTNSLYCSTTSGKSGPQECSLPFLTPNSAPPSTAIRLLFPQLVWNPFPDVPKGPLNPRPMTPTGRPRVPTARDPYHPILPAQLSTLHPHSPLPAFFPPQEPWEGLPPTPKSGSDLHLQAHPGPPLAGQMSARQNLLSQVHPLHSLPSTARPTSPSTQAQGPLSKYTESY